MNSASIWQPEKQSPLGHWSVHGLGSSGELSALMGAGSGAAPRAGICRRGSPAALFLLRYVLHSDFPLQASRVRGSALPGESDRSAQPELFIEGGGRGKGWDRHRILLPRGCGLGEAPRSSWASRERGHPAGHGTSCPTRDIPLDTEAAARRDRAQALFLPSFPPL